MSLLFLYVFIAISVSFICSVLEAVLLSVNAVYIASCKKNELPHADILKALKADVSKPLAAILSLNTIAHTIGAAGAGAQAAVVFGNAYLGVFSAVLTLLILVLSEIIPKTIGANYWRQLAPYSAYVLKYLIWFMYPFIKMAKLLTDRFEAEPSYSGFNREEFAAMAELSSDEGLLEEQETHFLKNLLLLRSMRVKDAMTPRTVIFALPETLLINEYFHKHDQVSFSRIPVYKDESENIIGYVLRTDLLLAQARNNEQNQLSKYIRPMSTVLETMSIKHILNMLLKERSHIMLVVNEYGSVQGIITLEDVLETALGFEIVDEKDKAVDMQKEARKLWKKRVKEKGIEINE